MDLAAEVSRRHWHHTFEIAPGVTTPGAYPPAALFERLKLADDLGGRRVLDVGARDGYFTWRCEQAGADVVAIDTVSEDDTGFSLVRQVHDLKAEFIQADLYDVASSLGQFDIVLFLGVIYHVPDPRGSLEVMRSLTRPQGQLYVESTCVDNEVVLADGTVEDPSALAHLPLMIYVRRNPTSFWDLNAACLRALLADTGFRTVDFSRWGRRMLAEAVPQEDAPV